MPKFPLADFNSKAPLKLFRSHDLRLGVDYDFSKDHQLSLVYNANFLNGHNIGWVEGSQISDTRTRSTSSLHNLRLDYRVPFGMKAGAEMTYYESPSTQLLHSTLNDEQLDFLSKDAQRINRWKFFLSEEQTLGKGWGLNYGGIYTTSIDHSHQYYYDTETGALLPDQDNMKGGAAGGGYAQVLPMEKINLHFTGDFHAITSAHNMISALLDNYLYQHQADGFALKEIIWKRVLDVNDRSLRSIVTGLGSSGNGITQESGFDITPASEIMAILCLAKDIDDLRRRIENIILGFRFDGTPFTVKELGVAGAITVLLKDTINPNLVQTTEGTAAFVHDSILWL